MRHTSELPRNSTASSLVLRRTVSTDKEITMITSFDKSAVLERIEKEFAERTASDARLAALMGDLHGAFRAALEMTKGDHHAD